jgi:hypothetical protein
MDCRQGSLQNHALDGPTATAAIPGTPYQYRAQNEKYIGYSRAQNEKYKKDIAKHRIRSE